MPQRELDRLAKRRWILRYARNGGVGAKIGVFREHFPTCRACCAEALNFAYLDAWHDYASTLEDLEALTDLIVPGGFMLGEDWRITPGPPHHGMFRAVQDFTRACIMGRSWPPDQAASGPLRAADGPIPAFAPFFLRG